MELYCNNKDCVYMGENSLCKSEGYVFVSWEDPESDIAQITCQWYFRNDNKEDGMTEWDLSWVNTKGDCPEVCPMCGMQNDANFYGTTTCEECGHQNIKPCRECTDRRDTVDEKGHWVQGDIECDWSDTKGCTPFPNKEKKHGPKKYRFGLFDTLGDLIDQINLDEEDHDFAIQVFEENSIDTTGCKTKLLEITDEV